MVSLSFDERRGYVASAPNTKRNISLPLLIF
jgi:hypothetical protein